MTQPLDSATYEHLLALARRIYSERGAGQATIQPTVLLHEAWMKLDNSESSYNSKAHFLATAAKAMRQILTDRARAQQTAKRGEQPRRTTLRGIAAEDVDVDVLALDLAIQDLAKVDANAAEVVILRSFGGMTVSEVADALDISPRSVDRTWRFARAFLADRLA